MPTPHASVNYVEPNLFVGRTEDTSSQGQIKWALDDGYERAPRLEDYSIAVNIEVELSNRSVQTTSGGNTNTVYLLEWRSKGDTSTVNFMGGTKVATHDKANHYMNYLTTNYADMYVEDLVDYGTTELIGIKSIDIQYAKSCVPIVTIQFTDVRGLSLFQPTELSRTATYNSITELNTDSIARSFFEAFFKLPMPKFTIYIKGFYGKPVSYQVLCDKFETKFNSQTGDFDVVTRFIGYSYSFLTDISMDALLAAPFSDYVGKQYWEDQLKDRFQLWNREKTERKPMPTLFEACMEINEMLASGDTDGQGTTLSEEEISHTDEIATLTELRMMYQSWYELLFNICKAYYGKKYCFLMKEDGDDGDYTGLLLLANANAAGSDMSSEYAQFPDNFKKVNSDLYAAVEKYNSSSKAYAQLENVSSDMRDYTRMHLFNDVFINANNEYVFNGFSRDNTLNTTDVRNCVFNSHIQTNDTAARARNNERQRKYALQTIYNDGVNQFTDCFFIGPQYSDIKQRINALQNDANRSVTEKEKEKKIKELNDHMYSKMSWYPSVENFTRIMMAHFETLMYMMFQVVRATEQRTASSLGVTIGAEGTCSDVRADVSGGIVPPFPRVTSAVIDSEDNSVKKEDSWIGDFNNGAGFVEREMVDGLFNAVDEMQRIYKESQATVSEITRAVTPEEGPIIKHPLAPFDFVLTGSPYGDASTIANDINFIEFAGRVAIRMFNLLSINALRWQLGDKWISSVKSIAESEAENFHALVPITNRTILNKLLGEDMVSPQSIISAVTSVDSAHPWGEIRLFSTSTSNMWLDGYRVDYGDGTATWLYPLQGYTFDEMSDGVMKRYNDGKMTTERGSITVWNLHNGGQWSVLSKAASDKNGSYMTTKVFEELSAITSVMNQANSTSDESSYTAIYDMLNSMTQPTMGPSDGGTYFKCDGGPTSFVEKSKFAKIMTYTWGGDAVVVRNDKGETYTYTGTTNYLNGAVNGDITDMFVLEIFGFDYDGGNGRWVLNRNSSYKVSYEKYGDRFYNDDLVRFYVMCIDVFDYSVLADMLTATTFTYVPKLAVLQMGAILKATNGANDLTADFVRRYLPCAEGIGNLCKYLNTLSPMAKAEYIRIFNEFADKYKATIKENLLSDSPQYQVYANPNSTNTERRFLKEGSSYVHALTNNAMKLVCIAKLTVNHFANMRRGRFALSQGVATTYLKAFLAKLKTLYAVVNEAENTQLKITKTPSFTTKDMKKELYRYLKQLYDKWIPASSFEDWKMESFFDKSSEENGHTFYFIDSFYNNIGDKLLINPMKLSEKVNAFMEYSDVNSMMLGFMADMYAQNKCMFLCLQNFYDLNKIGSMADMFVPYSYEDAPMPNEYPSFVVVYPYEPSKNLDTSNSEYNNDSFMLNDERETPIAITSRMVNEDTYLLPAFGVTYGKQYQSFFTNVNVDMTAPVATQQSIKAKHYIIRKANDDVKKTTIAQDMYDIYTTQSYTCKVEMLGCPWVQPMMYFVLLNIPMFRGSYMIMSVTHRITPGNMVTEFTGCRMANIANSLVQNIFIGEDAMSVGSSNPITAQNRLADVSNDCPYKVYPLFDEGDETQGANVTTTPALIERAKTYHDKLVEYGLKPNAAWGVVGNLMQESTLNPNAVLMRDGGSAGLAQWHANYHLFRDMYDNRYADYGHWPQGNQTGLKSRNAIKDLIKERSAEYQLRFIVNSMRQNKYPDYNGSPLNELWENENISISRAATIFCNHYEKPSAAHSNLSKRIGYAQNFAKKAGGSTVSTTTSSNANTDIRQAFFKAVQKSVNSTPSINVTLSRRNEGNFLYIWQQNGKTDKLGKVFDVILNGYYEYVNTLVWIYGKNALDKEPLNIAVLPSLSVQPNRRRVLVVEQGTAIREVTNGTQSEYNINGVYFGANDATYLSRTLRESLYKKYRGTNYEIPQFTDDAIFDGISIENCDSVMKSTNAYQIPSAGSNSLWAQTVRQMGEWFGNTVKEYNHGSVSCPLLGGAKVRPDCSGFVSACLRMFGALQSDTSSSGLADLSGNVAEALRAKGFKACEYNWDAVQPYDIIVKGKAHTEILADKGEHPTSYGWGSAHYHNMPARADTGKLTGDYYQVIWRYVG